MSSQTGRKNKQEVFAYSWFMPAPGSESHTSPTDPLTPEEEHVMESVEQQPEVERTESRPLQFQQMNITSAPASPKTGKFSVLTPRVLALAAWGAIGAVGVVDLLLQSGRSSGALLGAVGGIWAAVAAAIWLIPSKLVD